MKKEEEGDVDDGAAEDSSDDEEQSNGEDEDGGGMGDDANDDLVTINEVADIADEGNDSGNGDDRRCEDGDRRSDGVTG